MEVSNSFKNHVLQLQHSLDGLTLYFSFSFSLGLRGKCRKLENTNKKDCHGLQELRFYIKPLTCGIMQPVDQTAKAKAFMVILVPTLVGQIKKDNLLTHKISERL